MYSDYSIAGAQGYFLDILPVKQGRCQERLNHLRAGLNPDPKIIENLERYMQYLSNERLFHTELALQLPGDTLPKIAYAVDAVRTNPQVQCAQVNIWKGPAVIYGTVPVVIHSHIKPI